MSDATSDLGEILDDLRGYVEFQKALGLRGASVPVKTESAPAPKIGSKNEPAPPVSDAQMKPEASPCERQPGIFDAPPKTLTLEEIRAELGDCSRCKLHETRASIVFGEGNPRAKLVFVGEGPGEEEDKQGRPFVGRAGQLLTKIIAAMGLKREDVYICNVVKCRPPANRVPEPDEVASCEPFLFGQLGSIAPEVVVCLGATAAQAILKSKGKLGDVRGRFIPYRGAKLMVTYHPAALLRNPAFKKPLWDDMQIVMRELGLSIPKKSGD
ncbi:MAG: uracil-DNA glycosylase [Deltaproteobacteria bacterium]